MLKYIQLTITKMQYISTLISTIAAAASAYFAYQSIKQNKISQIPILEPEITDVTDPKILKLSIINIGNGLAKNIKIRIIPVNQEISFETDLLPRKFQDFRAVTLTQEIKFSNEENPLFQNGELLITYKDIYEEEYSMRALFKPDVNHERKKEGHIDKNFKGCFYS